MKTEPEPANLPGQVKKANEPKPSSTVDSRPLMVKAYSMKELAALYGITTKGLRGWMEPHQEAIGERIGHYFTAKQVRVIFDTLGKPGYYDVIQLLVLRMIIYWEPLPRALMHAVA